MHHYSIGRSAYKKRTYRTDDYSVNEKKIDYTFFASTLYAREECY